MAIRVILGGPSNSGKSTLAESLARVMRSLGIDAYAEELDLASPTLKFIRGEKCWEERAQEKQKWTIKLAKEARRIFKKVSDVHDLVLGDAPGQISDISRIIVESATHAVIVCRDDSINEIDQWKKFFESFELLILAIVVSKMEGSGQIKDGKIIRATVVGLERVPKRDEVIVALAMLIKKKLEI